MVEHLGSSNLIFFSFGIHCMPLEMVGDLLSHSI